MGVIEQSDPWIGFVRCSVSLTRINLSKIRRKAPRSAIADRADSEFFNGRQASFHGANSDMLYKVI